MHTGRNIHPQATGERNFKITSPYMAVSDHGYTKHYYAGTERLAARVGGGFGKAVLHEQQEGITRQARDLFHQSLGSIQARRPLAAPEIHREQHLKDAVFGRMASHISVPESLEAHAEIWNRDFLQSMRDLVADAPEPDVYFYHSDHLGSASWITDANGEAVQHLQYLPYGEPYINQRTTGYNERFTFTGKERDEETGYGYFGARYMDYELMTSWLSVDPLADKYPSISPYAYCAWNPIKLIDPDGRKWKNPSDEKQAKEVKENVNRRITDIESSIRNSQQTIEKRAAKGKSIERQKSQLSELQNQKQLLEDFILGLDELDKSDVTYTFNPTRGQFHECSAFASPDVVYSINYQTGNEANLVHEATHAIQAERISNGTIRDMTGMEREVGAYSTEYSYSPQSINSLTSSSNVVPSSRMSKEWIRNLYFYENGKKIYPYKDLQ